MLSNRERKPKYGFFILNRMGMHDYIRSISQHDEMSVTGQYLMYRSQAPFKSAANRDDYGTDDGGGDEAANNNSEVIGLWTMETEAREPMSVVLMRLFGCVKKGVPYPEEYRCAFRLRALLLVHDKPVNCRNVL